MAGGPDHPPEIGPEAERPQAWVGAVLTAALGTYLGGQLTMRNSLSTGLIQVTAQIILKAVN